MEIKDALKLAIETNGAYNTLSMLNTLIFRGNDEKIEQVNSMTRQGTNLPKAEMINKVADLIEAQADFNKSRELNKILMTINVNKNRRK